MPATEEAKKTWRPTLETSYAQSEEEAADH